LRAGRRQDAVWPLGATRKQNAGDGESRDAARKRYHLSARLPHSKNFGDPSPPETGKHIMNVAAGDGVPPGFRLFRRLCK
jgi:hypothetical protein